MAPVGPLHIEHCHTLAPHSLCRDEHTAVSLPTLSIEMYALLCVRVKVHI